jgi:hypothetical protein
VLVGTFSVGGLPGFKAGFVFACSGLMLVVAEFFKTDRFIIIGFSKLFPVAWI